MDCQHFVVPLIALTAFIVLDIITGVLGAVANSSLSSTKMRTGLLHKIAFYCAFALGVALEICSGYLELGFTIPTANAIALYVIATEVVSILENLCVINPELKNNKFLGLFGGKE